jgi:hypothetical protein
MKFTRTALHFSRWATGLIAAAVLAGCASLNTVTSEVSTYGDRPAGHSP